MSDKPRSMVFTVLNIVNDRLWNGAGFFYPERKHKNIAAYKYGNDLFKCM